MKKPPKLKKLKFLIKYYFLYYIMSNFIYYFYRICKLWWCATIQNTKSLNFIKRQIVQFPPKKKRIFLYKIVKHQYWFFKENLNLNFINSNSISCRRRKL
jgi:hypothetical protein